MPIVELRSLAEEIGLDVVGAAPAAPYEETERHIRERRERGLFGQMRFTMVRVKRPLSGCVISAASCLGRSG